MNSKSESNPIMPVPPMVKYFDVKISPSKAMSGCFDLVIWRLMKVKESLENGLGPNERWTIVDRLRCIGERDAMCLVSMLERPREPLQNREEEALWAEKLKELELEKSPGPSVA
jgi:hypothetical protein